MSNPAYQELESAIDECMLADRFRMRRDLKKKKERRRLAAAIESSRALALQRRESLPGIRYPRELPISGAVDQIKSALENNQVVIVAGETGSGKTTQLPKICLQAGRGIFGMIGHTQPRRVAARTIAARLAEELEVKSGEQVGYQVRFQDESNPETLIKVMTDGILLAETRNDRFLERYDTIIIDEAHERSLNIDFLLGYIKRILPKRPDLKVIITSATIDLERFSRHFGGAPVVEVSGRTYPVQVEYRPIEASDADDPTIQGVLDALHEIESLPKGDVLVFLPGEREIRETAREIKRRGPKGFDILPLYSRLGNAEQNRVFAPSANPKIVLATNVAETSLTVPGIRYVIDPGLARISRYSFRSKVQQLPVEPVSQASANQRMGRCGRVSEGVCFRLYSQDDFEERPEYTEPEILRTNLAAVILQMLQLRLGDIGRFPFVERPGQKQINDGFALLYELSAVDRHRQITRLGRQLSRFPIDLRFARMLIAASQYGALQELLVIVSALTVQDPRERPFDHQQAADEAHRVHWDQQSDFLALTKLWQVYEEQRQVLKQSQLRKYCKQNFLSFMRMREWREMHRQLLLLCREEKLKPNRHPAEYADVHRSLLTGLLGHVSVKAGQNDYQGARNRKQFIFPGSSQFSRKPKWIVAAEIVETSRLYARTVAEIESRWIEPIAGHLVVRTHHDPHFDEKLGQVMAREEVTLYGIVISADRLVDFGTIDAGNAREMFIDEALVQGKLKSRLKFFNHNRRLIRDIERLESKARKRDILVESRALHDFYDQFLPADVTSEIELRAFVTESDRNAKLLELTRDELMRREADLSKVMYPDQLTVGNARLPLNYKFEPGAADDGISVDVPLVLLNQVPRAQLDWIVPGLLREKCLALIKSLPKSLRKNFVPAPEYADRVVEHFEFSGKPLAEALAEKLFRLSGVRVAASDFQPEHLDGHLTLNIRVVDDRGRVLARGRDIHGLIETLGQEVSERLDARQNHSLEQTGLVDWPAYDELPSTVSVKEGGITVTLHSAIQDDGDSVSVRLVETAERAEQLTRRGLLKLFMLRLKDMQKYLANNIPGFEKYSLYYATRGSREQLTGNLVRAAFQHTFIDDQQWPSNRQAFDEKMGKKSELYPNLERLSRVAGQVLPRAMSIDDRLKSLPVPEVVKDIRSQLDQLVSSSFPADVAADRLRHYPRYLRGIEQRLERYGGNTHRDTEAMDQIAPWLERFARLDAEDKQRLDAFRWMLEEYRISLFAQSLGTSMPVSDKRLAREWETKMGLKT